MVKTNAVDLKFGITKLEKIIEVKKLRSVGTVDGRKYLNFNQLKSKSNLNLKLIKLKLFQICMILLIFYIFLIYFL